ncbi:MAG: hypothetical protein J6U59_01445 [Alistipes sp.]|nr:hypothetical protein [Alistipes sp.]
MKKMLVLSLVLSVMAVGSAVANDVNSAVEHGPRRISVTINVPPGHGHGPVVGGPKHDKRVCRECPPGRGHNSVAKPRRNHPRPCGVPHRVEHGRPHNHHGHGAPGKPHPRPGGERPGNGKR